MKKFQKAIIAILITAMILAMAGCGGAKPSELAGSWGTEVSVQNSLLRGLGSAAEGYTEPLTLNVYLTMDAEGNYTIGPDPEESGPAIMAWADGCADYMVQKLYDDFKAIGKSEAEAEKMLEKQYGMPAKEFLLADMQEKLNLNTLLANYTDEGTYSVKGSKISFAKSGMEIDTEVYETVKVKDNTLTLTIPDGGSAQILRVLPHPLELIKK